MIAYLAGIHWCTKIVFQKWKSTEILVKACGQSLKVKDWLDVQYFEFLREAWIQAVILPVWTYGIIMKSRKYWWCLDRAVFDW